MSIGLIVTKLVTTVILLLSNVITMFLPNFIQQDETRFYKDMDSLTIFENTLDAPIPQTEISKLVEAHFRGPLAEGKTEKKVLIMGWDGARSDGLANIDPEKKRSGVYKLLNDGGKAYIGYCGGVPYPAVNTQATSTAPGWASILTGEWADVHGITDNGIIKSLDTLTLQTRLTQEGLIDKATFYTLWSGHFNETDGTYAKEIQYCKDNNLPVDFQLLLDDGTDTTMQLHTLKQILDPNGADLIFSIYEIGDHAGHSTKFGNYNPFYRVAMQINDTHLYSLLNAVESRATYDTEDWLIIVASDHGGVDYSHGGPTIMERSTFILTNQEIDF